MVGSRHRAGLSGSSSSHLGYALEFRSQLALGYTLPGGSRPVIAVSHLSNGTLGSR